MARRRKTSLQIEQSEQDQQFELPEELPLDVKNNKPGSISRNQRWDQVDANRKREVVRHMRELLPELDMQPQRILQYLRLLYVSNVNHINGLEKLLNGQVLTKTDVIPSENITMMPVMYPETGGLEETEDGKVIAKQILSPTYTRFIENIKRGMGPEDAGLDAGFSKTAMENELKMILKPNPSPIINSVKYKNLLIVWKAYWDAIKERIEAAGISEDYVLSRLKRAADFNVKDLFDGKTGLMKDIASLDDDTAKMITKIRISEVKYVAKDRTETRTISLELGNRENALKEVAKLQAGIFNHVKEKTVNHRHTGAVAHVKVDPARMNDKDLDRIIALDEANNDKLLSYEEPAVDAEYEQIE